MTHTYQVNGMTCNGCVNKVKIELLKLVDILKVELQLDYPQATITMKKHIATDKLQQAISKAGHYTITDVDSMMDHEEPGENERDSYYPVFLIFGYIAGASLLIQLVSGQFSTVQWMSHFMAGFFLVFSFFKLLNVKAFAEGYQTYDLVAKAFPVWGFIYPFIELLLGILFLTGFYPLGTNIVAFFVMGVSSIGVVKSLLKKSRFQCACLGTIIKLPLSKVTLFEDLLMVTMSAIMIIRSF
ncbi:MAG: MauE/DoxX family redox-associated membrane protein [Chitinophagaceae bacterium]